MSGSTFVVAIRGGFSMIDVSNSFNFCLLTLLNLISPMTQETFHYLQKRVFL